jgi:hypothetical protein
MKRKELETLIERIIRKQLNEDIYQSLVYTYNDDISPTAQKKITDALRNDSEVPMVDTQRLGDYAILFSGNTKDSKFVNYIDHFGLRTSSVQDKSYWKEQS